MELFLRASLWEGRYMQTFKVKCFFLLWILSTVVSLCLGYMSWHAPVITDTITQAHHVRGHLYKAMLPQPTGLTGFFFTIASLQENSNFTLRQDGRLLQDKDNSYLDIETEGNGKYIYRYGQVYFSTLEHAPWEAVEALTYEVRLALSERGALLFIASAFLSLWCFFYVFFPKLSAQLCSVPCASINSAVVKKTFFILLFLLTFFLNYFLTYGDGQFWRISADTPTYWAYDYADPWGSVRSPGLKMFVDALGVGDITANLPRYDYLPDTDIKLYMEHFSKEAQSDAALKYIVFVQQLLICFSLSVLACSLGTILPCFWAGLLPLLVFQVTIVPKAYELLTEPMSFVLCMLCMGMLLLYEYYKKSPLLLAAIAIVIYAFLLRPSLIVLAAVVGIVLLRDFWQAIKAREKMHIPVIMGGVLLIGILLFPAQLYFSGNVFAVGQLSFMSKVMRALALAEESDILHMENEKDKRILQEILQQRPYVDLHVAQSHMPKGVENYSDIYRLSFSFDPYGRELYRKIATSDTIFRVETYVEGQRFAAQILQRHGLENTMVTVKNFLNGFGLYAKDYMQSPVLQKVHLPVLQMVFFPLVLCILGASLLWGLPCYKMPILLFSSIHILHVTATATGNFILMRYLELTEWSILLAVALALYSLCLAYVGKKQATVFSAV